MANLTRFYLLATIAIVIVAQIVAQNPPPPTEEKCGENEEHKECNKRCPDTCENYKDPPKECSVDCVRACICKDGYVKDMKNGGKCVKPDKCLAAEECGKNEVYEECNKDCPKTCENYKDPPKQCSVDCVAACICKDEFIKDMKSGGKCVKPDECPAR